MPEIVMENSSGEDHCTTPLFSNVMSLHIDRCLQIFVGRGAMGVPRCQSGGQDISMWGPKHTISVNLIEIYINLLILEGLKISNGGHWGSHVFIEHLGMPPGRRGHASTQIEHTFL